ncbi:hypothetical protein BH09PSE2_BH09PSE2_04290 [soil metagenome]
MVAALLLAAPAVALDGARDRDNPTCPPLSTMSVGQTYSMQFRAESHDGRRVLIADGGVGLFAAQALETALKANAPIDEIWLNSPGGLAAEGLSAGRLIRRLGIPTRVPDTAWCASACTFIFLGGSVRQVDPQGVFAVHMFTEVKDDPRLAEAIRDSYRNGGMERLTATIARIEQDAAEISSAQNDFLIRMGVSRRLLTDFAYRQKSMRNGTVDTSTLRCLTGAEMRDLNVINVR